MTDKDTQEVIEVITGLYRVPVENGADEFASKINKAIDMAIDALNHQTVFEQIKWERDVALQTLEEHGIGFAERATTSKTETVDTDIISRQAAIDALMAHFIPQTYTGEQVERAEKLAKKIMNEVPPVEPKPVCEDAISRADTLKAICAECDVNCEDGTDKEAYCTEYAVVKSMPPVELKQKWTPCSNPPKHHRDVLVRGVEAVGNVKVHKVMQWDVDRWRPMDYSSSVTWEEWCEI